MVLHGSIALPSCIGLSTSDQLYSSINSYRDRKYTSDVSDRRQDNSLNTLEHILWQFTLDPSVRLITGRLMDRLRG